MENLKKFYPIFMNLEGLSCLVVGGGKVSERKVMTLLSKGAKVILVSPEVTPLLSRLAKKGKIRYVHAVYAVKFMRGVRLVVGATGNPKVNEKIFRDAEKRGIPVNIVDQPHLCRFIVPAVMAHKDITVAVCTGGAAPGVTAMMRKELEGGFFKKYAPLVGALKKLRAELKALPPRSKKAFWKRVKTEKNIQMSDPIKWLASIKADNECGTLRLKHKG